MTALRSVPIVGAGLADQSDTYAWEGLAFAA
jgi:hypothetical protein